MPKGTPGRAVCSVDGCTTFAHGHGLCRTHLTRFQKYGDPLFTQAKLRGAPTVERFWSHVEKTETCWLWIGSTTTDGYGSFRGTPGRYGRVDKAHRWSYEHFVGPIPEGLTIDHLCRVRNCVNPEHLEPVTPAENMRRALPCYRLKTHCIRGHALSGDNLAIVCGARVCKTCRRIIKQAYLERKKRSA